MFLPAFVATCTKPPLIEPAGDVAPSGLVVFQERTVDLPGHVRGYPYRPILVAGGRLHVEFVGDQRSWRTVDLGPNVDLGAASPVNGLDWATRSRWDPQEVGGAIYYIGDERNDERLNLWRVDPATGDPRPLTDEPYLYGFGVSEDQQQIAILPRRPRDGGGFRSCLDVLKPDGTGRREVLCDDPSAPLTWSEPSFAPDGGGVALTVNLDGRRDRSNVAYVPLGQPELVLITPPEASRGDAWALSRWLDADTLLYVSDETGMDALYAYDVRRAVRRLVYAADRDITAARLMRAPDGPARIVAVLHRPDGDAIVTVDPSSGAEVGRAAVGGGLTVLGDDGVGSLWLSYTSGTEPFAVLHAQVAAAGPPVVTDVVRTPAEVRERLVTCEQRAVRFPTFDLDPSTGEPREIAGFLYVPKDPPPPSRSLVRVQAFYGGDDAWRTANQVFCDAGVTTLSAAVRGSAGFGPAFEALNDGDLGGDEIRDLFAAGRWLETQGYRPEHIGVFGGSHGGYATQRALTWPVDGGTFGEPRYPFAFGMSDAGFSDIRTFFAASNIPDWVVLEAGDPADVARMDRRSPLHQVDQLAAPLFLAHGENDRRVPVAESRQMAKACADAGRDCTYVEFPGQGHQIRGLDNEVALYTARLAFLEREVLHGRAP